MTLFEDILSTATTPIAWRRTTVFLARMRRLINRLVAAASARRDRHATLSVLRHLTGRELSEFGLTRSQIDLGLEKAARERSRMNVGVRAAGQRAGTDF